MNSLIKSSLLALTVAGTLSTPVAAESIRMGTDGAYAPFNFVQSDGQISGFDVDIANAVCAEMKVKCDWSTHEWSGIIPALKAGKFDVMAASMAITAKRREQINFSNPYYFNSMRFAAHKDAEIGSVLPADLDGMVIGTQTGSVAVKVLRKYFPDSEIKLYPKLGEAFMDVENGRIDLVLEGKFAIGDWLKKDVDCCEFVGDSFLADGAEGNAMALRKGDEELLKRVNTALATIMENGTYENIRARYFGFDIMTRPKSAAEYFGN